MSVQHILLSLLIALSLIFSGCLGFLGGDVEESDGENGFEGEDNGEGDNGDGNGEGNQTGDANDGENVTFDPPQASLSANVTEGAAPLSVSFTLEAEHEQPEALSWSLDLGNGDTESGEGIPATFNQTFEAAGNYTVVLTVSHGDDSDEANLTITVVEAGNPVQTGSSDGACLNFLVLWAAPGVDSPFEDQVSVEGGTAFVATSTDGEPWVDFFDAEGEWINGTAEGSGDVPNDAAYAFVCPVLLGGWPDIPVEAEWTYQDGL